MDILIPATFFISIILLTIIIRKRILSKRIKQLRETWGKLLGETLDVDSAKIFFELSPSNSINHSYCIDDDTWDDLDFDEIFFLMNRTTTPTGAQFLYYLLRHPVNQKSILEDREKLIDQFSKNQSLREKLQLTLQSLSEKNAKYLPYSFLKPLPEKPPYTKILPFLSFLSTVVLLLVLGQLIHFAFIFVIFSINLVIRGFIKRKIEVFIHSFQYLTILINTADKLTTHKFDELGSIQADLKRNLKDTRAIAQKIFALQYKDAFGFIEYLNIYFLLDVTGFYSAINKIQQHLKEIRNLFEIIGYVDAFISVASFRINYPRFCLPVFDKDKEYTVEGIYNPIIKDAISNDFEFRKKNVLITGSNMAGKTTFLKTMGVNAILAQTINTCLADNYQAPFLNVVSSIGVKDNLLTGKSYYLAEVESILRVLQASELDTMHLFILDEIFRGTNSVERHAASIEVLKYLVNDKDFILVATHDLQLSEILEGEYANFHFREKVSDDGLTFDYKLNPGPSTTRNAIALLEQVGYPKSIVEKARDRIKVTAN